MRTARRTAAVDDVVEVVVVVGVVALAVVVPVVPVLPPIPGPVHAQATPPPIASVAIEAAAAMLLL